MSQGFNPPEVIKMRSFRKERQPPPLLFFKLHECEARIYN
jgi:hypothetical protein